MRFNPIQIAEWMESLLPKNSVSKDTAVVTLATELGISRTRTTQFLNLMRIPVELRARLKSTEGITEAKLRPMVQLKPAAIRVTVEELPGVEVLSQTG